MKSAAVSRTLGIAALAAFAGPVAIAQEAGWYGGLNVGQSRSRIDEAKITSNLLGAGFSSSTINSDNRDTGFKLFGGYKFNRNFAVEGGYFDLGKFGYVANTIPAGTLTGTIRLNGVNLDAVGIIPITEKFSIFGRVGANYAHTRDTFAGTGPVNVLNPNPSKRDTNYKFGFGAQYDFTEALGMRIEAERYRVNDAVGSRGDVDMFSVGVVYRFGAKTPAPVARAAARPPERISIAAAPPPPPAPVIAPPPPPPQAAPRMAVPVPPPARPAPTRVTFSADSLFDFDKSTIKPAGAQALDKFASDLSGTQYETIQVTGHTDRIGSNAYNMKLSERRAGAVKTYLVDSKSIPAGKVSARGVGETEPVTKAGDCKGAKATKALIACLQPDRRVDVEVTGTK